MTEQILVAGIGNALMGDDAAGPSCAERLIESYSFPANVDVVDLGSPGLRLAVHLSNADRVLVIGALRGLPPGTMACYDCAAIFAARRDPSIESHSLTLGEAIQIARLAFDRPHDVRLIGVAGASFDHGTGLSGRVRACMPSLTARVLEELFTWGVEWQPRQARLAPARWEDRRATHPFGLYSH